MAAETITSCCEAARRIADGEELEGIACPVHGTQWVPRLAMYAAADGPRRWPPRRPGGPQIIDYLEVQRVHLNQIDEHIREVVHGQTQLLQALSRMIDLPDAPADLPVAPYFGDDPSVPDEVRNAPPRPDRDRDHGDD